MKCVPSSKKLHLERGQLKIILFVLLTLNHVGQVNTLLYLFERHAKFVLSTVKSLSFQFDSYLKAEPLIEVRAATGAATPSAVQAATARSVHTRIARSPRNSGSFACI